MLMGVKASLTLGREEFAWVKGLVGLNNVVERFSHVRRWFLYVHGARAPFNPYACCISRRYKGVYKRRNYLKP